MQKSKSLIPLLIFYVFLLNPGISLVLCWGEGGRMAVEIRGENDLNCDQTCNTSSKESLLPIQSPPDSLELIGCEPCMDIPLLFEGTTVVIQSSPWNMEFLQCEPILPSLSFHPEPSSPPMWSRINRIPGISPLTIVFLKSVILLN